MWTLSENKEWTSLKNRFAWVAQMDGVPQDAIYHAEGDVAIHTQLVLAALRNDPEYQQLNVQDQEILWAAALLHDVEKFSTTILEPDGSITSHGHARKGAMTARKILYRDIPTPFIIREQIVGLVRYHGLPLWIFEKPDPVKALITASFDVNTKLLTILARADAKGRICHDQQELLFKIDCFEAFCQEQNCWAIPRQFASPDAQMYYIQNQDTYPDYIPFDKPVANVILMSGLPGAGKDYFISKNYPDKPIIALDDIRREKGILPTDKAGNGKVIQEAKEMARVFLRKQQPFVWNATNTTRQMRAQLIDLFTTYKVHVEIVYVEVPYKVLRQQNSKREAAVPANVLEKLITKLEVPSLTEAHQVTYVNA